MNLRAVIFDLYGTLLEVGPPPPDADALWRRLFRELLHQEPPLTRLEFSTACHLVIARLHRTARARGIQHPEVCWPFVVTEVVPELARLTPAEQDEFLFRQMMIGHTTRLSAEAAGALRWLKQRGCVLGIASNAQAYTRRELQAALASRELGYGLFEPDLCFWSYRHGFSKPDPHVFQILAIRLEARGIPAPETLMVGDRMDNDVEPARAFGWRTWHLEAKADSPCSGDWLALRRRLEQGPLA